MIKEKEKLKEGSRERLRRKNDRFLFDLFKSIQSTRKVKKGLRELLVGLEELGYLYPRVYRYDVKEEKYILVDALDLPEKFCPEKISFNVSNPILRKLEEIIKEGREERIYIKEDVSAELIEGERDPLDYIKEKANGEGVGFIGIPYVGFSETHNGGEIRGVIAVNYNPKEKIIDGRERNMLEQVGVLVGVNVIRQLENKLFRRKQKELEELTEQLARQVKLDGPTGLYNKKTFHEDLEGCVNKVNKEGRPYYLMMIDFDDFKVFNDEFGHAEGDKVISRWGEFLKKVSEEKEVPAYRVGGDEFGMVAELKAEKVRELAEAIRDGAKEIPLLGDRSLAVSIGIVAAGKNSFRNGEEWYQKVDVATYEAKRSRDKIVFYG